MFEYLADHVKADPWASLLDVAHSEWPGLRIDRSYDKRGLCPARGFDLTGAALEFAIGTADDGKHMIEPGQEVVLALMPAPGAFLKDTIVVFLPLFNKPLQADVPPHFIALLVEREQRKEAGDAAVAVSKWVDTKEVEHERADGHERRDAVLVDGVTIDETEFVHGSRRGFGGNALESDDGRRARTQFDDFII